MFHVTPGHTYCTFTDLKDLLAKAPLLKSGDELAGRAASSASEREAARWCSSELPPNVFLSELLIPHETDEVTRLSV